MEDHRDGFDPPAEAGVDRDALLEEIRSLRVWSHRLEQRLARKSEQADIWRTRAEERKERIERLKERLDGRPLRRRVLDRVLGPPRPRRGEPATDHRTQSGPATPSGVGLPLTHPTIRLAVLAGGTPVPPAVACMDHSVLDAGQGRLAEADALVVLEGGAGTMMDREDCRRWLEEGHPTVAIDASVRGIRRGIPSSDLAVFRPAEDVFRVPGGQSPVDDVLHPTLDRIWTDRVLGGHLADLTQLDLDEVASADRWLDLERRAISRLRRLRRDRSPDEVGRAVLEAAGVTAPLGPREALATLVSNRPHLVLEAIDAMTAQTYRPLRIAVGLHGPAREKSAAVTKRLEESGLPHLVMGFEPERSLGYCLNAVVASAPGDVVLKIDDDDLYSTTYVEDAVGLLEYSGASIVGKSTMFVRRSDAGHTLLEGRSYAPVDFVYGPTLTLRRSAWDAIRFPDRRSRVDSKFLWGARNAGEPVIATHPFEMCFVRHTAGHTWSAGDEFFRSGGRDLSIGWHEMTGERERSA